MLVTHGGSLCNQANSSSVHTVREFGNTPGSRLNRSQKADDYSTAHLPYERTFPATYQEFLTKDDLAKGFREWQAKFNIVSKTYERSEAWEY